MRNPTCRARPLQSHSQTSAIAFLRWFIVRPATSFNPCLSMESSPRSIAGKTRFSISARSAATKRRSGWRARKDRWKGVKSNSCPQNRRCHREKENSSLNDRIAHTGEAFIRHVRNKNRAQGFCSRPRSSVRPLAGLLTVFIDELLSRLWRLDAGVRRSHLCRHLRCPGHLDGLAFDALKFGDALLGPLPGRRG